MYLRKFGISFIEGYTGITNAMLNDAPPCRDVMHQFADFIDGYNLVAHNASFDKRFLDSELKKISRTYAGTFVCSMLLARRIYQDAPNHQLGTLVDYANIPSAGKFHRALYDSEMTTKLWLTMLKELKAECGLKSISFTLTQKITRTPKNKIRQFLQNC